MDRETQKNICRPGRGLHSLQYSSCDAGLCQHKQPAGTRRRVALYTDYFALHADANPADQHANACSYEYRQHTYTGNTRASAYRNTHRWPDAFANANQTTDPSLGRQLIYDDGHADRWHGCPSEPLTRSFTSSTDVCFSYYSGYENHPSFPYPERYWHGHW